MRLSGVDRSPNRSTPRRRCRHKNLTDPLKLSDACCQNCVSWTATSAVLPRSETERSCSTTLSCIWPNEANLSQSIQWLTNGAHILIGASAHPAHLTGKSKYVSGNGSLLSVKCHHSLS